MSNQKAGFIALVGRPNVGKSSLLNKILGQKLSIVSSKVQTTRHQIRGIYNHRENTQMIFIDLPGIHKPLDELGEACWSAAKQGSNDADLIVFVVEADRDIPKSLGGGDKWVNNWLTQNIKDKPIVVLLNKFDLLQNADTLKYVQSYKALFESNKNIQYIIPISAQTGQGVSDFLNICDSIVPEHEFYYSEDDLTDRPMRFIVSELIREKVLNNLSDEIPHSCTVEILEYREDYKKKEPMTYINARIIVERETQKQIVIGKKGSMIKKLGMSARRDIEELTEMKVFLDLNVKVSSKWRKNKAKLENLGYIED